MMTRSKLNSSGMTLVEIMVVVAISAIVMLGILTVETNQVRESTALSQKLAALDLERVITNTLADGSVCSYLVTNMAIPPFDPTAVTATNPVFPPITSIPSEINSGVPSGAAVLTVNTQSSPLSPQLQASQIALTDFKCPAPCTAASDAFPANLTISFNNSLLIRAKAPLSFPITIATITSAGKQMIAGCSTQSTSSVPLGVIMAWHKNQVAMPPLPAGWVECDGQTLSDGLSPFNGTVIPSLNSGTQDGSTNSGMFLRGGPTSGIMQEDATAQNGLAAGGYKLTEATAGSATSIPAGVARWSAATWFYRQPIPKPAHPT